MSGDQSRSASSGSQADSLQLVQLDISRIQSYEHNPRRSANPEYARIKASIHADGLLQPLMVTQRPGDSSYIIRAGGNTRLEALKELFAETGDTRFATAPCVVHPWTDEADVLLAHLKENELRGELTFLDKALGIHGARRFLEDAEGTSESMTQQQLVESLRQHGYTLSQSLLSQMLYAVDRLLPLLPQALGAGMGRPQVSRIRRLDRAARACWLECQADNETEYELAFEALCRRYDAPEWDITNLRRALESEIAERAEISLQAARLEMQNRLSSHQDTHISESRAADDAACSSSGGDAGESDPGIFDLIGTMPARTDIKSMRARMWTLATRLSQRNGLGDLVRPLPGAGFGYLLLDVPDPAFVAQLDRAAATQVWMIWWWLAACSEAALIPPDVVVAVLSEGSALRTVLLEREHHALPDSAHALDPWYLGQQFWSRLDERDWQDLLALMDTYRSLRQQFEGDDRALWVRSP